MAQATTRRTAIGALAAIAIPTTSLPTPSMCAEPDPVFELISALRGACVQRGNALSNSDDWDDDPEVDYANLGWMQAAVAFFSCTRTTAAGVAAALEYCNERYAAPVEGWGEDTVIGVHAAFTRPIDGWPLAAEMGQAARTFLPRLAVALRELANV